MKLYEVGSMLVVTLFIMLVSVGSIKHTALWYKEKQERDGVKVKVDPEMERPAQRQYFRDRMWREGA